MSLRDYIQESNQKAANQKIREGIVASQWEERAAKAVDECVELILRVSKNKIDKIVFNNKPHNLEIVVVVTAPQQDEQSKEEYPHCSGNAPWSRDGFFGVSHHSGDAAIYVCNRKEQEYCASKIEERIIKEGFRITDKRRTTFRCFSSYIIITANMTW